MGSAHLVKVRTVQGRPGGWAPSLGCLTFGMFPFGMSPLPSPPVVSKCSQGELPNVRQPNSGARPPGLPCIYYKEIILTLGTSTYASHKNCIKKIDKSGKYILLTLSSPSLNDLASSIRCRCFCFASFASCLSFSSLYFTDVLGLTSKCNPSMSIVVLLEYKLSHGI